MHMLARWIWVQNLRSRRKVGSDEGGGWNNGDGKLGGGPVSVSRIYQGQFGRTPLRASAEPRAFLVTNRVRRLGGAMLRVARQPHGVGSPAQSGSHSILLFVRITAP